jgi:hypothetical protein
MNNLSDRSIDAVVRNAKNLLHAKIDKAFEHAFAPIYSRIKFAEQRLRCGQKDEFPFIFSPTYKDAIRALNWIEGICDAQWINTSMIQVYPYNYRFDILRRELISDLERFLEAKMPLRVQWAMRETHDHNGNNVLLITFKFITYAEN